MSKVIDVYDDVLEDHNAVILDDNMKQIHWKYDYPSKIGEVNKHWHILCGHNKEECDTAGYDWADEMFDMFKIKLGFKDKYMVEDYVRIYFNAHTHGLEPHMHTDDGDFTMIYYPRLDWKPEWMGGTAIWNEQKNEIDKYVNYIGNRLFVFDANLPHQAMTVSRECYQLRTCVVFKTERSDANSERLNFYK